MVDTSAALIKLTAKQLMLESERIVSNQTEAVYASALAHGFLLRCTRMRVLLLAANKKFSEVDSRAFCQ